MTDRENYLSIVRRTGFEHMPVSFDMTPYTKNAFKQYLKAHPMDIPWATGNVYDSPESVTPAEEFAKRYYAEKPLKKGASVDMWGIGHEPGSAAAYHMTYMRHPMEDFDSVEQVEAYPFPVFGKEDYLKIKEQVDAVHEKGMAAEANLQCSDWEISWYLRGMENLMCDMMTDDPIAEAILDKVMNVTITRAENYARAGADAIFLGDDIGTQRAIMMSIPLYEEWLMPRLKKIIDAAHRINPDIVILYHSCGHVTELIPSLIKAGVQVLNPVQPEVMDFREIHEKYGDVLSFHGTIGTQSVMPFGTPDDVRRAVFENLDIAGDHGGLLVCPTHILEPEVPPENIAAYIQACKDYK